MKRILLILMASFIIYPVMSQVQYLYYRDGKIITIDSISYRIENDSERVMEKREKFRGRFEELAQKWGEYSVIMHDVRNFRMGGSQYIDGTAVEYSDHADEIAGIILPKAYYKRYFYHAIREAFSKEKELIPFHDWYIFVYVVVDNQGNILETATGFPVNIRHVIQPEQIATLESLIRKNLKFEVTEKAKKFNFFEGEIFLPFAEFIEDLPEFDAKALEEDPLGDIPSIGGGNLSGPPRGSGGN